MPDTTNENERYIGGLLGYLSRSSNTSFNTISSDAAYIYHAALTALVAERDALASEVGGLRSAMKAQDDRERDAGERCGVSRDLSGCDWPDSVADEVIALQQRVAELEAKPADRDLRAKIDELSSSVSILTCRVAALESAKFVGPHVPVNPWNPYPTTPWITCGTRTSDRIEESA